MSVSLITACKNRNKCLQAVLPSWLQHKEISEIIIIDWSSKDSLEHLTTLDQRIKVVRVDNEEYYIPSQANNLGISVASGDSILRIDTDYFLNPYYNFFESYKIDNNSFVSGEPENYADRENNPYYQHLFGLLYITKENFNKIGGYDENIGFYYSHEDGNIFKRLVAAGLNQIKLKNNHSVIHIPHSDEMRCEHFAGKEQPIGEHFVQNKKFYEPKETYKAPNMLWNIQQIHEQFYKAEKTKNKLHGLPSINCVSLEESTDRREYLLEQFRKYNINNINFLISKRYTESNDIILGKLAHTLNEGTAGCCVSHIKMIKQWLENTNEQYGFFCEDDLSLKTVQYWDKNWEEFISELPSDWESIQLLTIRQDNLSLTLRERMWNDWSATAYILKREYAQKLVDLYYKEGTFALELPSPNEYIQPLIENLLFTVGKTYTVPLFVENVDFVSTFVNKDGDINSETLHKNNHIIAHNNVLSLWKNKNNDLFNLGTDIEAPVYNFKMGEFYFNQGHTAPALSYFLRCAERTDDVNLAYEALIYGYLCYKEQKIRDETAKSLIMHAVCLLPERPEARWLLSVFFEQKQEWMYSYYQACQGLITCDWEFTPLRSYKDYPGKVGLLFQKAIVGYWWEKHDECKNILLDLWQNYTLNEHYKKLVKENLQRLGIKID